jgi:hypothetical protein
MAKKTWVKVKRGLLTDPKHRIALDIDNKLYLWQGAIPLKDADLDKIAEEDEQRAKKQGYQIIICDGGSCWT